MLVMNTVVENKTVFFRCLKQQNVGIALGPPTGGRRYLALS